MPYLTKAEIESIAARVFRAYRKLLGENGNEPRRVEPERLAKDLLGLTVLYRTLAVPAEVLGLTSPGEVDVGVINEEGNLVYEHIDGKTILVSASLLNDPALTGHLHFTLMHEISHQIYKMLFPKAYAGEKARGTIHYCKRPNRRQQSSWEEWRTDSLAAAILMPPELVRYYLRQYGFGEKMWLLNRVYAPEEYVKFTQMAESLGVSKTALAIRLKELGLVENDYFKNPYELLTIYPDDDWMKEEAR